MKKFDLSAIMRKAWKLYRKGVAAFSECLHRAWNSAKAEPINAQRIEKAQQAAGVAEPVNTWAGWKAAGYMVEHGAKALFQAVLIHSSKGDGQTYRASFFGASQVKPLPTARKKPPALQNTGGFFHTSVPSGKRKFTISSAPMACAICSSSSYLNFPVFIRWLNACGVVSIRRASSASFILETASAILIFVGKSMFITSPQV